MYVGTGNIYMRALETPYTREVLRQKGKMSINVRMFKPVEKFYKIYFNRKEIHLEVRSQ